METLVYTHGWILLIISCILAVVTPLYLRLSDYYQNWYLLSRDNLSIVRALSKYGMVRFYLVILNYTD